MKQVIITIGTILFTTFLYGQGGVGINNSGNAPNTSAMLDVASTNKGLLIPRVSLTSTTDATTITNGNVTSLLVYNTVTIADVVPGYYYWDGTVWKTIGGNDADADPTNEIQDLQLVGNNLTITNNGTPTTIDLSSYLDNTDDQNIDSVILNGSNLTVYIEDGTSSAVDLSSLSDHDWYEVGGTTAPDNITDDIYTQGDVGIGEILPKASLDVDGDIIFGGVSSIEWHLKSTSGRGILASGPNYNAGKERVNFRPIGGGGQFFQMTVDDASSQLFPNYSFISDNNTGIFNRAGSPDHLYFATNGIERQVIDANGNVGIGETNPTNKLSIGTNLGTGYGISVNSGSPYGGIIETLEAIPSSNPAFWVRNTDGTNTSHLFRVQNNGNVGVGTINPTEELHVEGKTKITNKPLAVFEDSVVFRKSNGLLTQMSMERFAQILVDSFNLCRCIDTQTVIFQYTGTDQQWTIPNNAKWVKIQAWGAAGGSWSTAPTSAAGYSQGTFDLNSSILTPGQAISIIVGQGGINIGPGGSTGNTYGFGGGAKSLASTGSGSGGGLSGIFSGVPPILLTDNNRAIIIAGGGGGTGEDDCFSVNFRLNGGSGNDNINAGGMVNMLGIDGNSGTGCGSGGYGGGGGGFNGGSSQNRSGGTGNVYGGNGGSGFVHGTASLPSVLFTPEFSGTPPNISDINYDGNAGKSNGFGIGNNGLVIISYF